MITALLLAVLSTASYSETITDSWYTVTVAPDTHYAYYNEVIELTKGRYRYQSHMWKKEEGYINEEQLGAFSEAGPELAPLFYNFHSTYRTTETVIDGTVKDGKTLVVKARRGAADLPLVKKSVSRKTFFSSFFPLWLRERLKTAKPNQNLSFKTILEDAIEAGFDTIPGSAYLLKADDYATRTKTRKIVVDYRGLKSTWWVDDNGWAVRIDMPAQKTTIERVSKDKALKFLNE